MKIAYSRTEKCSKYSGNQPEEVYFTSAAHQTWTHKKLCQGNESAYLKISFPGQVMLKSKKGYLLGLI